MAAFPVEGQTLPFSDLASLSLFPASIDPVEGCFVQPEEPQEKCPKLYPWLVFFRLNHVFLRDDLNSN